MSEDEQYEGRRPEETDEETIAAFAGVGTEELEDDIPEDPVQVDQAWQEIAKEHEEAMHTQQYGDPCPMNCEEKGTHIHLSGHDPVLTDKQPETVKKPYNIVDHLDSIVPDHAYHEKRFIGKTWHWTTPCGIFMMRYEASAGRPAMQGAVIMLDFKALEMDNDRVQMVMSLKAPTADDIEFIVVPTIMAMNQGMVR